MIQKKIRTVIRQWFDLPKGHHIPYPLEMLIIDQKLKIQVSRKSFKHIIESRKENGYSLKKIEDMISKIPETISDPDLIIPNTNKKYPQSIISGKLYIEQKEALLVIYNSKGEIIDVITVFFRGRSEFNKLRKKYHSAT